MYKEGFLRGDIMKRGICLLWGYFTKEIFHKEGDFHSYFTIIVYGDACPINIYIYADSENC